jgi:carotenoid cleavage dioxygenase
MDPLLPQSGVLPPEMEGTLCLVGPDGKAGGGIHAVSFAGGRAVSYRAQHTDAHANVFWHAGRLLALAERGLPEPFSQQLEPQPFGGDLRVPIASHTHRDPASARRVIFGVSPASDDHDEVDEVDLTGAAVLRIGEWDDAGALTHALGVALERATWQHDVGVTAERVAFIESPTRRVANPVPPDDPDDPGPPPPEIPFEWTLGDPGWLGVLRRDGDGSDVRWISLDPCVVTHVMHAHDDGDALVLYVCRYEAPEAGQFAPGLVVGPAGIGRSRIGGTEPVLERWRLIGAHLTRQTMDERPMEYPTTDPLCAAGPFRYGYAVELGPAGGQASAGGAELDPVGLLRVDTHRDEVATWSPGAWRAPGEPLFVRADDGRADDEGWLLTVVHDANRGASDVYVLDASSFGRPPLAVVQLPVDASLPRLGHAVWVPA